MTFILILIVMIACAGFCEAIAKSKGHSKTAWAMAGFFFGPLAVLAAVGLGTKPVEVKRELTVEEARTEGKKEVKLLGIALAVVAIVVLLSALHSCSSNETTETSYSMRTIEVAGIPLGTKESTVVGIIERTFGKKPNVTRMTGDSYYNEKYYYYSESEVCGTRAAFKWWIGSNGLLTSVNVVFDSEMGAIDSCVKRVFPIDKADRTEGLNGPFPLYYFDMDGNKTTAALYTTEGLATHLYVMWARNRS